MKVPYLDLPRLHSSIREELMREFDNALTEADFVMGKSVDEFESEFARFSSALHCVAVSSGTSAIQLALEALGVGAGDEVIVPANTFTASAAAVLRAGAKPVFVDVDKVSGLLTAETVLAAISRKTRAVIPVHLHGNVADVQAISSVLPPNVVIVEDSAQAHGAKFAGKPVGEVGAVATYSFYPGKNLGALGDAGAITTHSEYLNQILRLQRNWGDVPTRQRGIIGYNERLDSIQARFLRIKLAYMPEWEAQRLRVVEQYNSILQGHESIALPDASNPSRVWHVYAVRVPNRDDIREHLRSHGVETKIHYARIVPDQAPYSDFSKGEFKVAREWADSQVSLPLDPFMSSGEVEFVANCLLEKIAKN